MNALDISIAAVLCIAAVHGMWKGLVRQLASVAGIVAGFFIASGYYERFAYLVPHDDPGVRKLICFIVLFLGCLIIAAVAGWLIAGITKKSGLGWLNRLTGGIVGFLKGFLIILVMTIPVILLLPADSNLVRNSIAVPYVLSGARFLYRAIPGEFRDAYADKVNALTGGQRKSDRKKRD